MHIHLLFLLLKPKQPFLHCQNYTELTRFNNSSGDYCCIVDITLVFFCDLMVSFLCITQSKEILTLVPSNYCQCFCIFILLFLFCGYTGHVSHAATLILLSHFSTIISVYSHVITTALFTATKLKKLINVYSPTMPLIYICLF